MSLSHDDLHNYYTTNFALMQFHHYSLADLEQMIPWEREAYIALVSDYVEKENQRIEKENQQRNR